MPQHKTGPERRAEAKAKKDAVHVEAASIITEIGDDVLTRLEHDFPDYGEMMEALKFIVVMLNEAAVLRQEARIDQERMDGEHDPVHVPTLKEVVEARDAAILAGGNG